MNKEEWRVCPTHPLLWKSFWRDLRLATQEGHTEIVNALLARGADPNVKENNGGTALMQATQEGHKDIVELLKKHGAKE